MGEQVAAPTKKLADFADGLVKESLLTEELSQVAYAACPAYLATFAEISGATDDEGNALNKGATAGLPSILRVIITAYQPGADAETSGASVPRCKNRGDGGESPGDLKRRGQTDACARGSEFLREVEIRGSCGTPTVRAVPRAETDGVTFPLGGFKLGLACL